MRTCFGVRGKEGRERERALACASALPCLSNTV